MKVLLLAAGRSRRMKPIADKNFLKFCGETLIEHQIQKLKSAGLNEIILIGGAHNLEKLQVIADKHELELTEQKDPSEGMAGAILAAETLVQNQPLMIVIGNDIVHPSAYKNLQAALNTKTSANAPDAAILAYKVSEYFPGGYLSTETQQNENGEKVERIVSIVEKPGEGNEPSDLVNFVAHAYKNPSRLFELLKESSSDRDDRYEVALDKLMKEQLIVPVPHTGFWQAVKFPWHILDLMPHFIEEEIKTRQSQSEQKSETASEPLIHPSAQIADSAKISGPVIIEEGVKVFDNAVILGPAYIGKNSVIAGNALVRGSHIGESCVVGFNTEVARSYVGDDTWFHSNYIGDSIIGNNCSFGAGALCANLRLDEKNIADSKRNKLGAILGDNIRIGVNTNLMPGIRIGENTLIGSGLNIEQNIEAGKFVTGETTLKIRDNRATLDPKAREKMKKNLH